MSDCTLCNDTGVYEYVCAEGTCELSEWCDCPAGAEAEQKLKDAQDLYRLRQEGERRTRQAMEKTRLERLEAKRKANSPKTVTVWGIEYVRADLVETMRTQ